MSNSSIWSIDRILSGAITPGQSGLRGDGNEGVLCIPQSSRTGFSPSDAVLWHIQDTCWWGLTPLQRYSWCILQSQPLGLVVQIVNPNKSMVKYKYLQFPVWKLPLNLNKSKVGDCCRGWPESFLCISYYIEVLRRIATPFPGLLHFTLDTYLWMLSVNQGGIKYHIFEF